MQKKEPRKIDLDIESKFKTIDDYLPKRYTPLVQKKYKELYDEEVSAGNIRQTKYDRTGNMKIIRALYEVAEDSKF
ncbi:hypothetical protein [Elizabethkingia ursingii]|uniref:Uncharacterized protein n=1 Tax=Elizabethkingia ursingii TaxID=1756150 RepID=A0AAJ3TNQ0_9FLAO|nr:hypothetical protein [Elizabethkingia ursingii]AQX08000.1 hypothetical protein BBD34_04790 [Elizabethkingia ursingii]OPB73646.1 hypothetical protein BAY32_11430 [Elizabethkingia ursingii]